MTRSPTTKAARRSFRGHVTPPVVETVRDRWLRKHRRQFEKYGFTDPAAQSRIVAAWAVSGYFDIDPAVFTELGGDTYFKPKAQVFTGKPTAKMRDCVQCTLPFYSRSAGNVVCGICREASTAVFEGGL